MKAPTSDSGKSPDPAFLNLLLEIDELRQDYGARKQLSLSFLWLFLGFLIGGWVIMQWLG